jgi:hypothetical protein
VRTLPWDEKNKKPLSGDGGFFAILRPMKLLPVTVALLLFLGTVRAQSHFQPGKILPDKGDTLSGWIDYQEWRVNPRQITFRPTPQGAPVVYRVTDLRYVEVTGFDTYVKAIVTKDMRGVFTFAHLRALSFFVLTITNKLVKTFCPLCGLY